MVVTQTYVKSPFENVMNFLSVIPHGHEKALKQAFYNAVALFVLSLCGAAGWALYYILEPFVKPLLWALLIGSVLHPFKHSLANRFEQWYDQLNASSTPLFLGFFMVPVRLMDEASETVGNVIVTYIKWIAVFGIGTVSAFLIYSYTPCVSLIGYIWYINSNALLFLMNNVPVEVFILVFVAYATALVFYWNEHNKQVLSLGSYIIWFFISLFVAKIIGVLQIPIFLFLMFALSFGFVFEVFMALTLSCEKISYWKAIEKVFKGDSTVFIEQKRLSKLSNQGEESGGAGDEPSGVDDTKDDPGESSGSKDLTNGQGEESGRTELKSPFTRKPCLVRSSSDYFNKLDLYASIGERLKFRGLQPEKSETKDCNNQSSMFIYAVMWACVVMMIWKNFWIVHFLPIPIATYFIKHIGHYFGVWSLLYSQWTCLLESVRPFIKMREIALFPPPIQGLCKVSSKLRINIMSGIHHSINSFASSLVILGLILFTFCFTFFIIFQIYAECIHLVGVGAEVFNSTIVNNPEFLQLLPEGWGEKMESVINDAYVYGREGISKQVRHLLRDVDDAKAAEFEKYVLELWDRIYQAWLVGPIETNSGIGNSIGPKVTAHAVLSSWDNFMGAFFKMPDLLNITVVTNFAKENVGTLLSLLESVWVLLKGNLNLIFQICFAALSLILGGGTVVLNFFISTIVFFTALFYLLSSSGSRYKPVELLSNFSPINGSKLGGAFESAINGVFNASLKMALFYGLWTWLIHNFFRVRIVYLPSVLAAVLGAVPFLGTYWASVPAVLDLWLAQQKGMQAIILFLFQCLPVSFVDTAIYREIKEGHPYMTGLAIAGGVFCMGIQGAIFGPLLLCCLLVALSMSSNVMRDSPADPGLAAMSMRNLRRDGTSDVRDGKDEGDAGPGDEETKKGQETDLPRTKVTIEN